MPLYVVKSLETIRQEAELEKWKYSPEQGTEIVEKPWGNPWNRRRIRALNEQENDRDHWRTYREDYGTYCENFGTSKQRKNAIIHRMKYKGRDY